jgi:hypothetical protein
MIFLQGCRRLDGHSGNIDRCRIFLVRAHRARRTRLVFSEGELAELTRYLADHHLLNYAES